MEDDDDIESNIKWEKEENTVQGIEGGVLGVRKKWVTGKLIGIPQRKLQTLQAFHPEESWGDEIGREIPFGQEVSFSEKVVKEQKRGYQESQPSDEISYADSFKSYGKRINSTGSFFHPLPGYHVPKVPPPAVIDPMVEGGRGVGVNVNVYVFPLTVIVNRVAAAVQLIPFNPATFVATSRIVYVAVLPLRTR